MKNKQKTKWVAINQVREWADNPRRVDESDIARLIQQLKKFGQYKPLLVCPAKANGHYTVLGGNMRLRALQQMGATHVWINVVHPQNQGEKVAYALSDNDRVGYYDRELLNNLILPVKNDFDLASFKVDLQMPDVNLENILDRCSTLAKAAPATPLKRDTNIKRGDMFQLGKHRLLCGDATDIDDVLRITGGMPVDLVFTDPPYGIAYGGGRTFVGGKRVKARRIKNDRQEFENYVAFIKTSFANLDHVLKDTGAVYVWHTDTDIKKMILVVDEFAKIWVHKNEIIWKKNHVSLGYKDYRNQHEVVSYGYKKAPGKFYGGRAESDVWEISRGDTGAYVHPTQKPVAFAKRAIANSTRRSEIVLDVFAGSGTTLIAAEELERVCYCIEIDPQFCQVIIDRWEALIGDTKQLHAFKSDTPGKAKRLNKKRKHGKSQKQ